MIIARRAFSSAVDMSYLKNFYKNSKCFDRVLEKVDITSVGDGKCTAEVKVTEEICNSYGTMHGGFSATLIDCISTLALVSTGSHPGVSVDIHACYLKRMETGGNVLVDCRTVRTGKTLAFLDVDIKDKDTGEILVKGTHTKFVGFGK